MFKKPKQTKLAFTLMELLVGIAIIGLLATLSVVALSNTRARARDSRRVSDVKQIHTALELYYNVANQYPEELISGSILEHNGVIFLDPIPTAPTPADGDCQTENNTYIYTKIDDNDYVLAYCLGNNTGGLSAGISYASPLYLQEAPGGSSLNSGLVGHWTFNEGSGCTTYDSSGNSNHGSLEPDCPIDSPNWIEKTHPNYALEFNGSSDYVSMIMGLESQFGIGDFSVSFWINPQSNEGDNLMNIMSANSSTQPTGSLGWGFDWTRNNQIRFYARSSLGAYHTAGGGSLNPGNWYHIVGIREAGVRKISVNAVLTVGGSDSDMDYDKNVVINIAGARSGPRDYFDGLLDDIRIYNRALTEGEISAIYNQ